MLSTTASPKAIAKKLEGFEVLDQEPFCDSRRITQEYRKRIDVRESRGAPMLVA
jgi:hypothetical protein